jgi:hypothetical protein
MRCRKKINVVELGSNHVFFLENGTKFQPLPKYTTSTLLQIFVLHAEKKDQTN